LTETYSANGQSLTTIDIAPAHVKAIDGELTITSTGNQRHVVVPGIGPMHALAGRFEVEPEHGQPHRGFRARHPRRERVLRRAGRPWSER
jgi:hypothetical protein